MSKKRQLDTAIWFDPWVRKLDLMEQHLFIYLILNDHSTLAGVYEIDEETIAFESKLPIKQIPKLLKRLQPKVFHINGWIVLRNYIKFQNYHSPKIATAIEKALTGVPNDVREALFIPDDFSKKNIKNMPVQNSFFTEVPEKTENLTKKSRKNMSQIRKTLNLWITRITETKYRMDTV
jgi:hypothetical protein